MSDHLSADQITGLFTGAFDRETESQCFDHIENCEACAAQLDQLLAADLQPIFGDPVPELSPDQKRRVVRRIFHRLHELELFRQFLRLALVGPATLLPGLLRSAGRIANKQSED